MTFEHTLRYLTDTAKAGERPLRLETLHTFFPEAVDARWICFFFPHDKRGSLAAAYFGSVLSRAGIHWAHVIDAPEMPPRDRFRYDGQLFPPSLLAQACQNVHREEIAIGRKQARTDTENGKILPSFSLPLADRVALCLSRACEKAGAQVLILEGEPNSPTLHRFADLCPGIAQIALLTGNAQDLAFVRPDTREVITLPAGRDYYRRLSDACAENGCRLSLVASADCHRNDIALAGQKIDYRAIRGIPVASGTASAAEAVTLAIEATLTLRRQEMRIPDGTIVEGIAKTPTVYHLSPLSVHPLLLADRVETPDDILTLCRDLTALSCQPVPAFLKPLRLWLDPLFADTPAARELCGLASLAGNGERPEDTSPAEIALIVGSLPYLEQAVAKWQKSKRAL